MTASPDAEARAGAVFDALADPTRRAVLRAIAQGGPCTATELATALPVSRQAIAKHLAVLDGAGLVASERTGREKRFHACPGAMIEAGQWLETTGATWDDRLARLARRVGDRARDATGPAGR